MLRQNSHITTCIENSLQQYFTDLDGQPAHDVYQMVLQQVELPLLRCVMAHCEGNQSKAAHDQYFSGSLLLKNHKEH